ncbi:MAG: hypothetical protein IPP91_13755 [Betaproteobacteria bacterium]|nr:hypothetical protein [Betaproteobacteria bacterium]
MVVTFNSRVALVHLIMSRSIRSPMQAILLAAAVACTGGCAGSFVVDIAINAQVIGRDETGRVWRARQDEITTAPRQQGEASPYSTIKYRGEAFEWTFGAGTHGLGGDVTNHLSSPLCFRFDQTRLSSNLHTDEVPLRVARMLHNVDGTLVSLGYDKPTERNYRVPSPLCFQPGKSAHFSLSPDLSGLFPTGKMFNVSWPDGEPHLTERGIGNWLKIVLPIEHGGRRETLEVTLTATDSKARISYY